MGKSDLLTLTIVSDGEQEIQSADIGVVVEVKSTHNLALPMTAAQVTADYNNSYEAVNVTRQGRTDLWSRICDPIGQLLGYIVDIT